LGIFLKAIKKHGEERTFFISKIGTISVVYLPIFFKQRQSKLTLHTKKSGAYLKLKTYDSVVFSTPLLPSARSSGFCFLLLLLTKG
jgi:hypothetical protein